MSGDWRPPTLLGTTWLVGSHASIATLLGKSSGLQPYGKTAEPAGEVSVGFLPPENPETQH